MRRRLVCLVLAALLPLSVTSLLSPATASSPGVTCGNNTAIDGLVGSATPVIIVHGWTGSPMSGIRTRMEEDLPSRGERQYLLFNYASAATAWPDDPRISQCLARYIQNVSERHRDRGGDGMVYLVAHSMGGLAVRFALDEAYGQIADLSDEVGGVVTLDTPFQGSMWGNTFPSSAWSALKKDAGFPAERAKAWHCLAGGAKGRLPGDCASTPPLDPEVPLAQVAGEVTVRRTLFGLTAYEMNLASDGIVGTDSQHGSRGADGAIGPNQVARPVVSCTVNSGDLGVNVAPTWWSFFSDNTLLDMYAGKVPPELGMLPALETLFRLLKFSGCSHIGIPEDGPGLREVDTQLSRLIDRGRELTEASQLRKLMVPADCDHPSEVIAGTKKDYGYSDDGPYAGAVIVRVEDAVFGDLTGDGRSDAVVPMWCTAGGVSWPERLLVYGLGVRLLGSVPVGDLDAPQEHADVQSLEFSDSELAVRFTSYEGAGSSAANYRGTLRWEDSEPILDYGDGPLTVSYEGEPSGFGIGSGVVKEADDAETWLGPAPQDFRDFVQGEWEDLGGDPGCPATVTVDRYSHLGFASGNLGSCGGYMALWAKDGGGWQEVFGYQEGPYCTRMSDRAQEAITALGIECLPSSEAVQGVLLGTEWPASGE